MAREPWDILIARFLVSPLRNTRVHPNAVTALNMVLWLGGAALYIPGDRVASSIGAGLFCFALMFDHADGALARMTGKTSRFGHYFDHVAGALGYTALFVCMGIGLRHSSLGMLAVVLGVAAGVATAIIFSARLFQERRHGSMALDQGRMAGFETEDGLYLVGPFTWLGGLNVFICAAAVATPLFALWVLWSPRRNRWGAMTT